MDRAISEYAPLRAVSDELTRAQDAVLASHLQHSLKPRLILSIHFGNLIAELFAELSNTGVAPLLLRLEQTSDMLKLAGIEPKARALRTFVDLNLVPDAPEVAHQNDIATTRTLASLIRIDLGVRLCLDVDQSLAGGFVRLIDTLEFKPVEPYASATSVADINGEVSYLDLG